MRETILLWSFVTSLSPADSAWLYPIFANEYKSGINKLHYFSKQLTSRQARLDVGHIIAKLDEYLP